MKDIIEKYMRIAIEEAMIAKEEGENPFGAVLLDPDNTYCGKAHSQSIKLCDPTAHAEVVAIRNACENINSYDLSGCELYTSCYPCPMCMSAIIWANIKKVYYGNTKEDAASIGFRDDFIYDYLKKMDDDNVLDMESIDRDDTIKTFNEYMNKSDKEIY